MRIWIGVIVLAVIIFSCQDKEPVHNSINGIWQSLGSAWILEIRDSTDYTFYDITSISCLLNHTGAFSDFDGSIELSNDTLSLLNGVVTSKFVRSEKLPILCINNVESSKKHNPIYNFEVFAETVKEHYAFMELNAVNWDTLYRQQKNKLDQQSTSVELYLIIEETLELLNDNHAYLDAPDDVIELVDQHLEASKIRKETKEENLPEYGDFQVAQMVVEHHVQEEMTKDSWILQWGKLNRDIGYIQVKAMWLFADLEIPEELIEEMGYIDAYISTFHKMYDGTYVEKEVQAVSKIMDEVMDDLSHLKSIVIDVRFNGGGQDAVSFEILRRFNAKKLQVAKQKLRYGDQFTTDLPLYLEGSNEPFLKPVYILTSQQTGSAAEAFSIATMAMINVKRIGASTTGALSTTLEKSLLNGWSFSISNEIYMDNEGNAYENIGVPVDYKLPYPADRQSFFRSVINDLESDRRHILNAIRYLEVQ